jgi:hypothetical protein
LTDDKSYRIEGDQSLPATRAEVNAALDVLTGMIVGPTTNAPTQGGDTSSGGWFPENLGAGVTRDPRTGERRKL